MIRRIAALLGASALIAAPALAGVETSAPFGAQPLSATSLGAVTGREDIGQLSVAQMASMVQGNTINGNVSNGGVSFGASTFEGASGLFVVTANSGNNVSINSALNVNISIKP